MRPRYETADDRVRQYEAIVAYCSARKWIPRCTDELAAWDYTLYRGERRTAIVEVKCRRCSSGEYGTYMIGTRKMETLDREAARLAVHGLLLVAWTDCIGVCDARTALDVGHRRHGGRIDRGDPADMESVLHIPIDRFTTVACPS